MKLITICGYSLTGKTTVAETLIRALKAQGYSVGSVKDIHFEDFALDVSGSNTDKHRQAGSELVTARGKNETDILYPKQLSMQKILAFYTQDFVVVEGYRELHAAKILTAEKREDLAELLDDNVIAISGKIAQEITEYQGIPVINCLENADALLALVLEKTYSYLPNAQLISKQAVSLKIDGKDIDISLLMQQKIKHAVTAILQELNIDQSGEALTLSLKKE
ncbi:MAG: molybdopterin-guanine dinucleotide biosynthesis protein B [Clostridia bacterium]